jgi:hypothetical protein
MRDPKVLSEWMDLDYFRRPRRLRLLRGRLAWATLLLGVVGVWAVLRASDRRVFQAGPVSTAHAMFNNDCAACHTESFQALKRLWHGSEGLPSVKDESCKNCHDGAPHHEQQVSSPNCASCHREHRGRAVLAQVADGHCTACHADLRRKDGEPPEVQNVSDFTSHPEFALWRGKPPEDHASLRFNHQAHLKETGVLGPDRKPVKLECGSCHQPDAERRYPLPVNYEKHCASCHALTFQVAGDWKDEKVRKAAEQFAREPAPHKAPAVVRALLRERYTRFVQDNPAVLDPKLRPPPERPIPGRPPPPVTKEEWNWVTLQLRETERVLFDGPGGCRYCHRPAGEPARDRLPEYAPTRVPARWYPQSVFNHDSHRLLACTECHPAPASTATRDVLVPRIATCQQCHHPGQGARSDCVTCHRYHDRANERSPNGRRTIADCLGLPGHATNGK